MRLNRAPGVPHWCREDLIRWAIVTIVKSRSRLQSWATWGVDVDDFFLLIRKPLQVLGELQREDLTKIAGSAALVSSVEKRIRSTRRKYWMLEIPSIPLILGIFAYVNINYIFSLNNVSEGIIAIAAFSILMELMVYAVGRSSPEYLTFKALIAAMSKVDDAIGSPPASKARKKLARIILSSSRKMQGYRPLLPLRLDKRIQAKEAFRASRALRKLTYLAMLGTDEELAQIKEALAGAALRIGITNWVQVGDLEDTSGYSSGRKGFAFGLLLPWLAGIVIPLVAALIAVLAEPSSSPSPSFSPTPTVAASPLPLFSPSSPVSPSPIPVFSPSTTVSPSPIPTASFSAIPTVSPSILFSASPSPTR